MKKFAALFAVVVLLCACASGIGRAASLAVSGVPPTVPASLDSLEVEYLRLASQEIEDIKAGNVVDPATGEVVPEAVVAQEMMLQDRQARIAATQSLFGDLRTWIGVEKGKAPGATQEEAAKTRAALLKAALDRIATIRTETKAKKFDESKKTGE